MMRFNVPVDLSEWNKKDIEIERDMSKKRNYDLRCVTTYGLKFWIGGSYQVIFFHGSLGKIKQSDP